MLGIAETDAPTGDNSFFHTNHLGTSRAMTDDFGVLGTSFVFTAFGERVDANGFVTRYGYVGSSGYESFDPPIGGFLHVGARWYDPETGRFLQRDPIGIRGGGNVYAYVHSAPGGEVDPTGLYVHGDFDFPMDGDDEGDVDKGNGGSGRNKSGPGGLGKTVGRVFEVIRIGIVLGIRAAWRTAAAALSRVNPTPLFFPYVPTCAPTPTVGAWWLEERYSDELYEEYRRW